MYQSDSAPWLEFFAWNTDGSAKTDLVYNTSGISIFVVRDNQANSSALTLSAASGPTDWAAGKFHAMGGNKYRVGIATASISSFTGQISVEGSYTGGVLTGVTREVSAYNPAGNPNTTTPPTVGAIADQVWDEARSGHVTAGTFGEKVNAELDPAARVTLAASQPDYDLPTNTELNAALAASDDATLAAIAAEAVKTSAIKARTDNLPTDPADQSLVEAAITAATSPLATPAQVNAQVLDVLSVDTFAELAAPPAATSSLKDKITWLFMYARNKVTQTAIARTLYRDDTTTVAGTSATSDNGTTFTKGEDT